MTKDELRLMLNELQSKTTDIVFSIIRKEAPEKELLKKMKTLQNNCADKIINAVEVKE